MDGTVMPTWVTRVAQRLRSLGVWPAKVQGKPEEMRVGVEYSIQSAFGPAVTVELRYNKDVFELQRRSRSNDQTIQGIDQRVVRRLLMELLRSAVPVDRGWVLGLDGASYELSIT